MSGWDQIDDLTHLHAQLEAHTMTEPKPPPLRPWVEDLLREHDAVLQANGYMRCDRCNFTRHPCDAYELAEALLAVLDAADAAVQILEGP